MYPASAPGVSSRFIQLGTGVQVRVAESGPANGAPVVLLHGWGASLYTFRHALESLPRAGFRAIAVDLRGFGLSGHPDTPRAFSLDAYLDDLDALADALALKRFALIGHSMGGGLALRYSLSRSNHVAALALINPTGLVHATALVLVRVAPRWVVESIGESLVPRWLVNVILQRVAFGDASRVTTRDVEEYWAATQIDGYMRAVRRTAAEFDWSPLTGQEARSLTVPALVVLGTRDVLVRNAAPSARGLSGASIAEVSGGHCVHEERPGEVYGLITPHLERYHG
jgi:pimeloyl-ACP methyl ester carboxylesterase